MLTNFNIGGTERQFANLICKLDSTQFDIHMACFSHSGPLITEVQHLDMPRPEFKISHLYSPKTLLQALRMCRYIRKNRVQIVHSYGFYPNVFAIPAARLAGSTVIASIRDTCDGLTPAQRFAQKVMCRMADCVLVNADAIRQTLVGSGYKPHNIVVIRNGIRMPATGVVRDGAKLRRDLGVPAHTQMILVFSRLNQMKGVDYFLDAAALVAKKFPDVYFVIAGDGAHRKPLEDRAEELGLKPRMVFTGFRTDVPDLLAEATLSVLPSLSEGLSNSLLESMAAGVPAIGARVGGNPEVIDDGVTGVLVPPRDPRSLADAMCLILGDRDLAARMGEAGRRRVREQFSVEKTVSDTEQLYRQLTETGRGKVVLVGPQPPPHGGIAVHVAGVRQQLRKAGIRCEILDTGKGNLGLKFAVQLVGRTLGGWKIHVHTNGHNRKSWLLSLVIGMAGSVRGGNSLTLHSGMVPEYLEKSPRRRLLARTTCSFFSRIVCVSAAIGESLANSGVRRDKIVIAPAYIPVQTSRVALNPLLSAWMERHHPVCSTTLFFRPEYGFDVLVDALEKLKARYPGIGCVVMGSGDGRAAADLAIREAGIEDSVLIVGDLDHDTCLSVMARSDVFLRPTREDGDSISVREALALGVPVVASRVGARPQGTVLFEAGNAGALAAKIEEAIAPQVKAEEFKREHAKA